MSVEPWAELYVTGLCVGVGNYRYEDKLDNTVRDVEEVNKRLNSVSNCYQILIVRRCRRGQQKTQLRAQLSSKINC
jgi:hypothetical protein